MNLMSINEEQGESCGEGALAAQGGHMAPPDLAALEAPGAPWQDPNFLREQRQRASHVAKVAARPCPNPPVPRALHTSRCRPEGYALARQSQCHWRRLAPTCQVLAPMWPPCACAGSSFPSVMQGDGETHMAWLGAH